MIHPIVLSVGYFVGFIGVYLLPYADQKLAFGKSTKFQDAMDGFFKLLFGIKMVAIEQHTKRASIHA